jgi:pimeloyl-ACP methyl ester carboxylesterase
MAATVTTTERRIGLPRFECHLREAGEGPPVVLLHGWPQDGGMWAPVIDALARSHRVLAPDLRGFGHSGSPPGDYSKRALAADVVDLLDAEGIERATVIGHDWGGWLAWLLALEHGERVTRFVSLDTPPPSGIRASPGQLPQTLVYGSYQLALATPVVGLRFARSERAMRAVFAAASARGLSRERIEAYVASTTREDNARAAVALYRTFLLDELPGVVRGTYAHGSPDAPGLVVMGGESPVAKMAGIPRGDRNLEVEVLPGVGHFMVDEAPDQVTERIEAFIP